MKKLVLVSGLFFVMLWTSTLSVEKTKKVKRVPWTTSKITGSLESPPPYRLERVYDHLKLKNPTVLTNAPGSDRLFIAELNGRISSFPRDESKKSVDLFFDLAKHLKGAPRVYGLAFHPKFKTNRLCYLCYIVDRNLENGTRVSRFKVTRDNPPRILPETEEILLTWKSGGHNGGCLKFGPDGYLYISTGDAGPAFPPDPLKTGQDISDLPASILRIDVDHPSKSKKYSIPKDNPFLNLKEARPEVWAYGFRNPWKMSFDSKEGSLWVGDVGWELWEMIYRVEKGGNYGWSLVEGPQEVHRERKRGPTPILPPTTVHSHTESRSITGGFVYRGNRLKELHGQYIYGDYVTGKIWGLKHDRKKVISRKHLADSPLQIIAFGVSNDQELFVVGYDGSIHRLIPNEGQKANEKFPRKLSQTGLFSSMKNLTPAPGVIPYSIRVEPWADYARAARLIAIPGMKKLDIHEKNEVWMGRIKGEWAFPKDSVLVKTLSLPLQIGKAEVRRLETQILHHDGVTWQAYNYIWNDEQTDAILSEGEGQDRVFRIRDANAPGGERRITWHHASRTECILCHTTRGGSVYGFRAHQITELETLKELGLFAKPIKSQYDPLPRLENPSIALEKRARAYLDVNCAHCHRRGGGGTAAMELELRLPLKKTHILDERPTQGTFAIHGARVVASGDPFRSVLYYRMAKTGPGHMPHFGASEVDRQGLNLIRDWIRSLSEKGPLPLKKVPLEKIDDLLSSTTGAMRLMDALAEGRLSQEVRAETLKRAESAPSHIRDLFERFLPWDKRVKRLGNSIKPEMILSRTGDALQGRKLFFESKTLQCRNCHRIEKSGGEVGPDLTLIAKKLNRSQLLESMLAPSKTIDPKFVTWLVETKKGLVHVGLMIRRNEKELVLRNAQGKDIHIKQSEVDLIAPQQKSLMPELLLKDLTAQQAADLLAFLSTLKK